MDVRFRQLWGLVDGLLLVTAAKEAHNEHECSISEDVGVVDQLWWWRPEKPHNRRNRAFMLVFGGCGGSLMGCCGGSDQGKPTTAENERECSISVGCVASGGGSHMSPWRFGRSDVLRNGSKV